MTFKHATLAACAGFALCAAAPAMAQTGDWNGLYAGGAVGFGGAVSNADETFDFDTNRDGAFGETVPTSSTGGNAFSLGFCGDAATGATPLSDCRKSQGNLNLAFRVGYDWQFDQWVVGVVGEGARMKIGDDVSGFSTSPLSSYTFTRDLDYAVAVRGRAGYASDRYLAYATGGVVWGNLEHSFTTTNTVNTFTQSGGDDGAGYQVGAGFEVQWTDNLTFGVEYLRTSLADDTFMVDVGPGTAAATNPFLITNPAGTFMRRSEDKFEYDTVNIISSWRF